MGLLSLQSISFKVTLSPSKVTIFIVKIPTINMNVSFCNSTRNDFVVSPDGTNLFLVSLYRSRSETFISRLSASYCITMSSLAVIK